MVGSRGSGLVFVLMVLGAVGFPTSTRAQAPTPTPRVTAPDVIVTASVEPIPASATSRSVTVITREDLERMGLRSVIEALRFVPGVDARARGPLDVQTDFSVRGSTFGQNLMLADGIRLNDSQSAHHNGEIPLPAIAVDRIEVVAGAGSAVHGADALGGTINVISRRGSYQTGTVSAGDHGLVDAQASLGGGVLPANWTMTGWGSRTSGFMFDREFAQGGLAVRAPVTKAFTIDARHQRRAFGANGFYGASPSKEWTDQTLLAASWQRSSGRWATRTTGVFRNHGDHFRWDIARPGFAENRHRTDAVDARIEVVRSAGRSVVTVGAAGGTEIVTSTNLGDHRYGHGGAFAEWQLAIDDRTSLLAGLRAEGYSTFGASASPSLSIVRALSSAVRVRASLAHAFRVPTYTELYYTDPSNLGTPDLRPERGWSLDGGVDWSHNDWSASTSVFRRWDSDVIDWLRASTADRWRSANVRDVTSTGGELRVTRRAGQMFLSGHYAGLSVAAPSVTLLSKYVLEYARHQAGVSVSVPLGAGLRAAVNVDVRNRLVAQTWTSYSLVSTRVSRAFGRTNVYLDASNLLDTSYREIAGVGMPGRWVSVGVTVR